MPYRYLEDVATADAAFEAWGTSLEEVFIAAADATMNVMVDDLTTIRRKDEISIELAHEEPDLLLFNFLNELVYLKDARKLLLRVGSISIDCESGKFALKGTLFGETPDPARHPLMVDVKAVTLHRFNLEQTERGWDAFVILDI